jgi:hypothetical protein
MLVAVLQNKKTENHFNFARVLPCYVDDRILDEWLEQCTIIFLALCFCRVSLAPSAPVASVLAGALLGV